MATDRTKPKAVSSRPPPQQKAPARPVPQVIHVYRYGQRFELQVNSPHCRTSGLQFVRLFCEGSTDHEAVDHQVQLGWLTRHPNVYELHGIYWAIVKIASRPARSHRGYLLDPDLRPLTDHGLAMNLGLTMNRTRDALTALFGVGLLEQVPIPVWDSAVNGQPRGDWRPRSQRNQAPPLAAQQVNGGEGVSQEPLTPMIVNPGANGTGPAMPGANGTGSVISAGRQVKSRAKGGTRPARQPGAKRGTGTVRKSGARGKINGFFESSCENRHNEPPPLNNVNEQRTTDNGRDKYSPPPGVPPVNSLAESAQRPPPLGPVLQIPASAADPWPGEPEPWSSPSPLNAGTGTRTGTENGNPPGGGSQTETALTQKPTGHTTDERQIAGVQADSGITGPESGSVRGCSTLSDPLAAATKRAHIACTAPPPGAAFPDSPLDDPQARAWAEQVFEAMGLTFRPDSLPGVQNLGSFASAYVQIRQCGLPGDLIQRIMDKSIKEAQRLGRKGNIGNKAAIWWTVVRKRIDAAYVRQ